MKLGIMKSAAIGVALSAAVASAQIKKVLITNYIFGSAHDIGRAKAIELFNLIGASKGFTCDVIDNQSAITLDVLKKYDVVVWNSMSQNGSPLHTIKSVWQQYLEGGGAIVSIHASGDTRPATWTWYMEGLLTANYTGHSGVQTADVWLFHKAILPNGQFHPVIKNQDKYFKNYPVTINGTATTRWANVWTDEWYHFQPDPDTTLKDLTVLMELDERNLRKVTTWDPKDAVDGYRAMAWARQNIGAGKGRLVYLVTGHDDQIHQYRDKGLTELWTNALIWASKNSTGCMTPSATNYNPWVDKDDGSCLAGTAVAPQAKPKAAQTDLNASLAVDAAVSGYAVSTTGKYKVVLEDASGRTLYSNQVACPCEKKFGIDVPTGSYYLRLLNAKNKVVAESQVTKR